jgi:hypothetical protein
MGEILIPIPSGDQGWKKVDPGSRYEHVGEMEVYTVPWMQ